MTDEQIIASLNFLEQSGVDTTVANLARDLGCHEEVLRLQLKRMLFADLVYVVRGHYFATTIGLDQLALAGDDPYPVENWLGWTDEVLTGIDSSGKQTEIINPAIPKKQRQYENNEEWRFISEMGQAGKAREIIENHSWLSVDKLAEYWQNGLLVQCAACGKISAHKEDKRSRDGRSKVCINCKRKG
jgi:hypothetical protein